MPENDKNHITTIRELLQLSKLEEEEFGMVEEVHPPKISDEASAGKQIAPEPLPVAEEILIENEPQDTDVLETEMPQEYLEEVDKTGLKSQLAVAFAKNYVRYPVIFVIALLFFYVLLNFHAVTLQIGSKFSPPLNNQSVVLAEDLSEYNSWIKKYYFYSSDQEILAANNDADRDGLSNVEEFYMNTNPFLRDTDGDGFDDGQELLNGYNPLYSGLLTLSQSESVSRNVDLAIVQSRKNFSFSEVASASVDGFIIDTSREGRISIAKLGIDVPLVWNKNFEWIQDDLENGAVHHPDTVYPGQRGMSSIHGHSSGYIWDGDYKNAFTKINFLEPGDEVFVTVFGLGDESRSYRYIVRSKQVYEIEDQGQFADQGGYHLNLSTSWPIGSARQRYVVTTELTGL